MRVLSITAKQKVMPVMAIISAAHNPRILPILAGSSKSTATTDTSLHLQYRIPTISEFR